MRRRAFRMAVLFAAVTVIAGFSGGARTSPAISPALAAAILPPRLVNPLDTAANISPFTGRPYSPCIAHGPGGLGSEDISGLYPEWQVVDPRYPIETLEGTVTADAGFPDVSYQDWPSSHGSHDLSFHVVPDQRFRRLLGDYINSSGVRMHQDDIEVEWETGLAGQTAGLTYLSAGHTQFAPLWNWPAPGDHVTAVGYWIWDRGHPPAVTEIHPARLLAINRALPETFDPCAAARARLAALQDQLRLLQAGVPARGCGADDPVCEHKLELIAQWHQDHDAEVSALQAQLGGSGCQPVLGTRVDVYASGQGSLAGEDFGVVPTDPMFGGAPPLENTGSLAINQQDYSFIETQTLPAPSSTAVLRAFVMTRPGDTFPVAPSVSILPTSGTQSNQVRVTIPWRTAGISRDAVFARTIYLYWDQGHGVPANYAVRHLQVTLQQVYVHQTLDTVGDGEYRVFAGAGSNRYFLNEFNAGLGDAGEETFYDVNVRFDVWVPPGGHLWVHSGGWESDAVDDWFGHPVDPYSACELAKNFVEGNLFTVSTLLGGCNNDPIGDISYLDPGTGESNLPSRGQAADDSLCGDRTPDQAYSLVFDVENLSLPW